MYMRALRSIGVLLCFCAAAASAAEPRVALVIGNSNYREAPLTAPVNDARAMAAALGELGFQVTRLDNVGREAMLAGIRTFVESLGRAETVGLFYFAGHGMQFRGRNFLIPVDADVAREEDIERQGIDIQFLLDRFGAIRDGMNILILDACRDNPFVKSGVQRSSGLAAIDGPPGTLVAFAAAPGQVAAERPGGNGIFTRNVLANIREAGLPIEEVFKRTRAGVLAETEGRQVPWENTSLLRDFYFRAARAGGGYRQAGGDTEAAAWKNVEASRNVYDFIAFMRAFPHSRYRDQILARINAILARLRPAPPALQPADLPVLLSEAYVGFSLRPLNRYSAEYYGLKEARGMLVFDIERGSLGERAGLQRGDIVLRVNGRPVNSHEDVAVLSRTIVPGESVDAVVWRNRAELAVTGLVQRAPVDRLIGWIVSARMAEKNYDRARVLSEYLAAVDDAAGQTSLGMLYYSGLGVPRDFRVAERWLGKAAQQGRSLAAALLASIYLTARSGLSNDAEAARWAKFSAEAGVPEGAALLAVAYFRGTGVERNLQEAVRWARIAAEHGQPGGMFLLGAAYENGVGGVGKNADEARLWYRRAREGGNAEAAAALKRLGDF